MNEWWTQQTAGWIGGLGGGGLGTLAGCFGALIGSLAPRGIARGFMLTVHAGFIAVGVLALVGGVVAISLGQPYHVWYPLVLIGGILTVVMGALFPVARMRYRQAELRRLDAEEIRRG